MREEETINSTALREQIEGLRHMTVGQLKDRYREVFGEDSRSNHKQFLFRRIAWRIQANVEGGLSERARRRALEIANNRYVGGVTSYLDVITAQSALLTNERLATQLLGQQMVASVYLVKALGGGWDAAQIQNEPVHPKAIQIVQQ